MTNKPIVAALGAALIACGSAASAAETQIYGVVSTGLYYQKAEGADHATVGMAAYKQTPTDSSSGTNSSKYPQAACRRSPARPNRTPSSRSCAPT